MTGQAAATFPYPGLMVFAQGSQVAIQPRSNAGQSGQPEANLDTLSIDLGSGSVYHLQSAPQAGQPLEVMAVLGLWKLYKGSALVVVTEAREAAVINGAAVYEVVSTKVITSPDARKHGPNRGLLALLTDGTNPSGSGRGLHFSYFYDPTNSAQRAAAARAADPARFSATPLLAKADARFLWNRVGARPILDAGAGAHRFVVPAILGFVEQLKGLEVRDVREGGALGAGGTVKVSLTLLARRAVARAGTRQWRRGADPDGHVANFVETEQLLAVEGPATHPQAGAQASFVEVRGSIPLLWTQLPNIKYKPNTVIAPSELSGPAHDKHLSTMVDQYQGVVAINLINHKGTEGKLEAAFRHEAARLCGSGSRCAGGLRYVAFDFHHECSGKRYHRLSLLWDQVAEDFASQGFFLAQSPVAGGAIQRQQAGVMRINCIDCLDRTNVVQGVLARKALEAVLTALGLQLPGTTLPEAYPALEAKFKVLWADHGDAISTQYAGTGAMKSGFTRTGKRTLGGVLDDGYKAVVRYYLNNYQDGRKQDAIDFVTGAYLPDPARPSPLRAQPSPFLPILLALLAVAIGGHNAGQLLRHGPAATITTPTHVGGARSLLSAVLLAGSSAVAPGTAPSAAGAAAAVGAASGVGLHATAASVAEGAAAAAAAAPLAAVAMRYVLVPVVLGLGLLALVVQNGKYLVNKPQLCPAMAVTVTKPRKSKGA